MSASRLVSPLLLAAMTVRCANAWDNGAALTPTRGWQNWNGFGNEFNASLTLEIAHFLKDTGLLAAGFEYAAAVMGALAPSQHCPASRLRRRCATWPTHRCCRAGT